MHLRRLFKMTHIHKFCDEITILLLHTIVILEFSFQGEESLLGCLKVVRGTCLRFERQTNSDAAIISNIGRCVVMLHTTTIFFRHRLQLGDSPAPRSEQDPVPLQLEMIDIGRQALGTTLQ